jgi:tetratricopeptide (TPR) repeat protein
MKVNHMDVEAMDLLEQNRGFEAVALLQAALKLDAQNPFTLNDLGVADEQIGDYDSAMKCYEAAAGSRSKEAVVVTLDSAWRGKPVSEMAAASEGRLEDRLRKMGGAQERAILFTLRGVSAMNANNVAAAKEDFLHAYSLDPGNAFSMNNRGFVAEMDGDLETAEFFYGKARRAEDSNARVGLATQHNAEGKKLAAVATGSDQLVDGQLDRFSQQRHTETGPIELTPRNGASTGDDKPLDRVPPSANPPMNPQPEPQLQ